MKNKSKIFIITATCLLALQALTILLSWVVGAVWPSLGIHSLLSGSGLRWLLSSLPNNLSDEYFIWFLLFCIFIGIFVYSELPKKIILFSKCDFRERFGIYLFFLIIATALLICLLLGVYPHSSLLGLTGHLFPGPYFGAVLLILGMSIFGGSVVFSLMARKVENWKDAEKACVFGLQSAAPVVVIYFLLKELVEMLIFVL